MESEAASAPSHHANGRDYVGVIYGDVGSTSFRCAVFEPLERNEYVQVQHETAGWCLGRVEDLERKTDLSLDRSLLIGNGESLEIEEKVSAQITVIGYRDDRDLLQVPRTPFRAGERVFRATESVLRKVIGLKKDEKHGAYVGLLSGHDIQIFLDINAMVQKHVSVLAKTGGGKSYAAGVLLEEFMKHHVTTVVLDPHGEYCSLRDKGRETEAMKRFDVKPRSYDGQVIEFSPDTKVNPHAKPLRFTLSNLDPRDILGLTSSGGRMRQHLTQLRRALDVLRTATKDYTISDIIRVLEHQSGEDPSVGSLLDELEYIREVDIFAREGTRIDELVAKGRCTVINLKGTPPDIQELIVNRVCTALFELRKLGRIPPMMLVCEESHNFCPQIGVVASSKIFRTIASEGRKFGLGLVIITQRAAKVDKNVLSQCNTQIILKVTNPNDLKAITASVEGLTAAMADEVQRLPIGVAIAVGGGIQMPLMIEVRPRETRHGGESVKVIED